MTPQPASTIRLPCISPSSYRLTCIYLPLQVRIDAECGAVNIGPFSVFGCEEEYVYPPCTYLAMMGEATETTILDPDGLANEVAFKVIDCAPQLSG